MLAFLTSWKSVLPLRIFPVVSLHSSILRSKCGLVRSFCLAFQSEHKYGLEKLPSISLPIHEVSNKNCVADCKSKPSSLSCSVLEISLIFLYHLVDSSIVISNLLLWKEYKGNRNWWLSWTLSSDILSPNRDKEDFDNCFNDYSGKMPFRTAINYRFQ